MQVFYSQQINPEKTILNEEESHHAARVLRLREGDNLFIMNGMGELFSGIIDEIDKKNVRVTNLKLIRKEEPNANKILLYVSPLKNADRFEWLVEKATEMGVSEIFPLISKNSVAKKINSKRINHIALSACKQSLRLFLPIIHEPIQINAITFPMNSISIYGYCGDIQKTRINQIAYRNKTICVFIGPEGDFTPEEARFLNEKNIIATDFGNERLRTETAAIFAIASIKSQLL